MKYWGGGGDGCTKGTSSSLEESESIPLGNFYNLYHGNGNSSFLRTHLGFQDTVFMRHATC